jgi:Flp pilus assembly protein TadB
MLLFMVAGAVTCGGAWMAVLGLMRRPVKPPRGRKASSLERWWQHVPAWRQYGAVAAFLAGLVVALVSGWVVAVGVLPAAVLGLPVLLMGSDQPKQIAKMTAVAKWTRSLAGTITAGLGLEQAIAASAGRSAPAEIRPQVDQLVNRMRHAGWSTDAALRAWADEVNEYTADLVAASLALGARQRGDGLADVLVATAESVNEQVRVRLEIEADRKAPRQEARMLTALGVLVLVGLMLTGQIVTGYNSPLGQMIFACLIVTFGFAAWWMRKMTIIPDPPRFIGEEAGRRS